MRAAIVLLAALLSACSGAHMPYPYPIAPDPSAYRTAFYYPGPCGPYYSGGWAIQVLIDWTPPPGYHTWHASLWGSNDNGVTWTRLDAANEPDWVIYGDGSTFEGSCTRAGDILYIFRVGHDASTLDSTIDRFDLAERVWLTSIYGGPWFGSGSIWTGDSGSADYHPEDAQFGRLVVRSDGSLLAVVQASADYPGHAGDNIGPGYAWYSGGVWTGVTLSGGTYYLADGAHPVFTGVVGSPSGSATCNTLFRYAILGGADRIHAFAMRQDGWLRHRTIKADNTLATEQDVVQYEMPAQSYPVTDYVGNPAHDAGSGLIAIPYIEKTSKDLRIAIAAEADDPSWSTELVAAFAAFPVYTHQPYYAPGGQIQSAFVDGKLNVFWTRADGMACWRSIRNAANDWTTPVLIFENEAGDTAAETLFELEDGGAVRGGYVYYRRERWMGDTTEWYGRFIPGGAAGPRHYGFWGVGASGSGSAVPNMGVFGR